MVDVKTACALVHNNLKLNDSVEYETKELVKHFCRVNLNDVLLGEKAVSETDVKRAETAAKLRSNGYPLQYILGEWEFFGRKYYVGEGVLVPRQDTETLVEVAVEYLKNNDCESVVDLCSGSGCIAITLSKETDVKQILAVEKSKKAIEYLKRNISLNKSNVAVACDDVLKPKIKLTNIDLIVANPPYLTKEDMSTLQKEVTYEPKDALFGGDDGMLFYNAITENYKESLRKGGLLAFEIGLNQEEKVSKILTENGFNNVCMYYDMCGIIRVITGVKI